MFKLHDIRKSRVWQEAHEEGKEEGQQEGETLVKQQLIKHWHAEGKSLKEIAELLKTPLAEVRCLVRRERFEGLTWVAHSIQGMEARRNNLPRRDSLPRR